MKSCKLFAFILLLIAAVQTHAIIGIGVHYGLDYSLSMDDKVKIPMGFDTTTFKPTAFMDKLPLQYLDTLQAKGFPVAAIKDSISSKLALFSANSPITLSRTAWKRSVLNLGGKIYVDFLPIIPIINAVELSFNIGAWEYNGIINYPTGKLKENLSAADIQAFLSTANYESILEMAQYPLTLEQFGMNDLRVFGLTKTPFTRMHFDLTLKKDIIGLPPVINIVKLYAGIGPSLHFATPVLTPEFIQKSLRTTFTNCANNLDSLKTHLSSQAVMKDVLENLIAESKTPRMGIHFVAGTRIKFPIVPFGIYVDGKYSIPFGELVDNADITCNGFILNMGLTFGL